MLPLIPALILLLLQGAPNVDRLARDGRLPQAFLATSAPLSARQSEAVLASLIAVSGDRELSQALIRLLQVPFMESDELLSPTEIEPKAVQVRVEARSAALFNAIFGDGKRSRDGPWLFAKS